MMTPQEVIKSRDFIQDQVEETTQALFNARSVREIQFLQQKLTYLKKRMKETKPVKATRPAKKSKK